MSQWKRLTGAATAMTWRDLLAVVLCACVLAAVGLRVFNPIFFTIVNPSA